MHYNNMYACIHNNCYVPTSRGNLQFTVVVVVSFSKIDSRKSLSYYLYAAGRWLKAVMIYYSNLLSNISMTVSGHKSMSVYLSRWRKNIAFCCFAIGSTDPNILYNNILYASIRWYAYKHAVCYYNGINQSTY